MIDLTVKNFDDFKRQVVLRPVEGHNRASADNPYAIAGRIGGSTMDLVIKGLSSKEEPIHIDISSFKDDKYGALQTLFKIFAFIAQQAKAIGQKVLPIDLGIAGFTTANHPNLFEVDGMKLPGAYGLHLLPNVEFERSVVGNNQKHPMRNSFINFVSEMNRALQGSGLQGTRIDYQDELNSTVYPLLSSQPDDGFRIQLKIINDTLAIGNSQLAKLEEGENVFTMVCGSGFNIGELINFNSKTGSFASLKNTETGHDKAKLSDAVLECFDKGFIDKHANELDPEFLFAGGSAGSGVSQGIEAWVKYFKDNYAQEFSNSILAQQEITNLTIEQAARQDDKFALARLTEYAKALGKFLNENFKVLVTDPMTKRFVITGSHIIGLLGIPEIREVFERELNTGRAASALKIVEIHKSDVDGMRDLVKARAAEVKAKAFLQFSNANIPIA